MKNVWINATMGEWERKRNRITSAMEAGADVVLADAADIPQIKQLGKIKTACFAGGKDNPDADVFVWKIPELSEKDDEEKERDELKKIKEMKKNGKTVAAYVNIVNKKTELYAATVGKSVDYLIITANDWRIIPLENLIAALERYDVEIIMSVHTNEETETALNILEKGVDGVLIETDDLSEIKEISKTVKTSAHAAESLISATVSTVRQLGMGDRVCIDTCNLMESGEGMLIGSQSAGLFLVHSEMEESPYVASRPFRVNAGAVYSYLKVGDITRYLSELKAGDDVTIIGASGKTRPGIVGRVKIESRPMMLIEAEAEGKLYKVILQNAETVKLVKPDGKSIAVTQLKAGDQVLVKTDDAGRHFGMKVTEKIIEN